MLRPTAARAQASKATVAAPTATGIHHRVCATSPVCARPLKERWKSARTFLSVHTATVAHSARVMSWSLLDGVLPVVVTIAGVLALGWLLAVRARRWWLVAVPACLVAAAAVTAAAVGYTEVVWRPFPDALPVEVVVLIGLAVLGVALALPRARVATTWPRRVVCGLAALFVLAASAIGINVYYGQFPTLGALVGTRLPHELAFGELPVAVSHRMPATGDVAVVDIPGAASGFGARPAMIYLPPAYLTRPRPRLPVLVLMAGQPGTPSDWFEGGDLAGRVDRFAAAHHGRAPIVVVADQLGSALANPLCVDGDRGRVSTYLDVDVPGWVRGHLQVDPDPRHWAVGGASDGGTCALQTALRDPGQYPTLLDIAGQDQPTLGSQADTVAAVFDGDTGRFRSVNPLDELAAHRYPGLAAMLTVSSEDTVYGPQQHRVQAALTADHVPVRFVTVPGRHGWVSFGPSLDQALPWLATRMNLIG